MSENFTAITWFHISFVVYVTLLSATQNCIASDGMMIVIWERHGRKRLWHIIRFSWDVMLYHWIIGTKVLRQCCALSSVRLPQNFRF